MDNGTPRSAPRAFYPEYVTHVTAEPATPGWDPGPEGRIDDGPTLRRLLGWCGIGAGVLGLTLPRGRAHALRITGAVLLVAGIAALDLLQSRRRSWLRGSDAAAESV